MKNIITTTISFLLLLFIVQHTFAQSPEAFNYQAVVRDAQGQIIQNQNVSFQLSVYMGSVSGTPVYTETHTVTTNQFGLANLQVGTGTPVTGTFGSIDWAMANHFLEVELDETGGSNYVLMGSMQLISVPYALHATTVEFDMVDDADADPTNEIQTISASGSTVTLNNGGGSFSINDADADPNNELQTISLSGSTATLSNSGGSFSIDDADANATNELNTGLTLSNDTLSLTDAGGTIDVDLSSLVDDQDWFRTGNLVYNDVDSVSIGSDDKVGMLAIGSYDQIQQNQYDSLPNQVWIGGDVNAQNQSQDVVKLMIGRYDNDGSDVYPIVAQDENGNTDFFLENRKTSSGDPNAMFAGSVHLKNLVGGSNSTVDLAQTNPTLAGGFNNSVTNDYATVSGGKDNDATGVESFVGGGDNNDASGTESAIVGGENNIASASESFIGGGLGNSATGSQSGLVGGDNNLASGTESFVGGGKRNEARAWQSGVASGEDNVVTENSEDGFIGGGIRNTIDSIAYAVIAGGYQNTVSGQRGAICGGVNNVVTGIAGTVCGGDTNKVMRQQGFIGGGLDNEVHGLRSSIVGGYINYVASGSDYGAIGGGRACSTTVDYAIIPGGRACEVNGTYGFASGREAIVNHSGSFVWADNSSLEFASTTNNQFRVRARGGAQFVTAIDGAGNATAGVQVASGGGSWSSLSDRNAKENFSDIDSREILERVNGLELTNWNYKTQEDGIRHIGPMAQDFYAAFGLGEMETRINTVDADGIALAAIQGLNQKLEEKFAAQEEEISSLKAELEALKAIILQQDAEMKTPQTPASRSSIQQDSDENRSAPQLETALEAGE